jgi:hypothetical protein
MTTCTPIAIAITSSCRTVRDGCDDSRVSNRYWPAFDLRLRVGEVSLRPVTEADLAPLADPRRNHGGAGTGVRIEGLDGCRRRFGVPAAATKEETCG